MTSRFKKRPDGFATKAIHVGANPEWWNYMPVVPPMYLSTTFKQKAPGENMGYEYSRSGNPTRDVLERCLASLDDAKFGLTFASGLAAASTAFSLLSYGDHVVIGDDIYGGTSRLIRQVIARSGIKYAFVDATNLSEVVSALTNHTKLVWIETPTNPLMKVADINAIAEICHQKGDIIVAVDNTFLTPYFQCPLELGADLVCYSLTKYMNGHTDVIMGAIITNSENYYNQLKFLQNASGSVPSPFDCYQVNRSLKTLSLRMEKHQKNAFEIAKFLESHDSVIKVLHPGLRSHPQHQTALKQQYGCSGVFSFYINGNLDNSKAFLKALKVFAVAESLGGYESLAELPSIMTHASVPDHEKKKLGISDNLIRLSVGLEDLNDLTEDLKNALEIAKII